MNPLDQQCFLNLNWDGSIDPALSSIGEISAFASLYTSNLPVNGSMPMSEAPILDQFCSDPSFVERAARFSSFDGQNYHNGFDNFGFSSSCLNLVNKAKISTPPSVSDNGFGSTVSDPSPSGGNSKKRKCTTKGKAKDNSKEGEEGNNAGSKRSKNDTVIPKVECNETSSENTDNKKEKKENNNNNSKSVEPPKDYIHVRARRGQATDSHSLAERVRREKISQRMKLLQDLVPGCNKVTGKAVMLDEIINYVQSLQRQVEFLSMKLATVNPQLDFAALPNLLSKDINSSCNNAMIDSVFPLDTSGAPFPFLNNSFVTNGTENRYGVNSPHQHILNGISNTAPQQGQFWEDNIQNVVPIETASSQSFHDQLQESQTKIEL
ncbi:hypothetical protein LUZ60_015703 [Juncus effusus]|nr:hypothetical protein LUZ60_015703 [Juncus effusus]